MKKSTLVKSTIAASVILLLLSSLRSKEHHVEAVKPFDTDKYLGKWYEIARLDYTWERNLDNVTATYSLRDDGNIKVDNKGYNLKKEKWQRSIGKAKSADDPQAGNLKVSFFGPFYSEYNVVALDKDYQYALVAGESTKYMWILSRQKTIPADIKEAYLKKAKSLGYNTDELVWVKHDKD